MAELFELTEFGQAAWLDFIRRSYTEAGELGKLVAEGLRGVTSNPTIFEKAIAGSEDYDIALSRLALAGKTAVEIYNILSVEDIRAAADVLRPVYEQSGAADGYVSLEVNPTLARDTQGTIEEACRLFAEVGRPNTMIKIPATEEGIPAITAAIASGVNVNATLIFSLAQYAAVAQAYIAGLEEFAAGGGDVARIASVASFFVSRVDSAVDKELQASGNRELQGKIAIANAKVAYERFKQIFSGERWRDLADRGAHVQRPLWASTSTKNPAYPDTLYVDTLIGPYTVNTLPPATLDAFVDHGEVGPTLESNLDLAKRQLAQLAALGIDLDAITDKLLADGVASFAKSFQSLMTSIAQKRARILQTRFSANLGKYQPQVDAALAQIETDNIIERIWAMDHTVWKPQPDEITNRLGWLRIAEAMKEELPRLDDFVQSLRREGYTHALLLGMGGSSLAPEVFRKTFGVKEGYLDFAILDSTDPGAVLAWADRLDMEKTLFIVSTKSGGTVETNSFFKYFYNRAVDALGADQAGPHFIAITDPGSKLVDLAARYNFRQTFLNDPNIGGRYSALSFFGLVPAALIGVDVGLLLERASAGEALAVQLGAIMGELAKAGCDKLTLVSSADICTFGDWVEQLIAESTGKEGRGILPVVGEALGHPAEYGPDRLFVYLRLQTDHSQDAAILALEHAGFPVVRLVMEDLYDLGAQMFLWELATAVAGYCLRINPFDQPNVESAKVLARAMVAAYQEEGRLPELPAAIRDGISVYGEIQDSTAEGALHTFLKQAQPGAYIALQAYIQPTDESDASLLELRLRMRQATRLAVTTGYGPRFLHSTGQLHKGDAGKGLFIQLTADIHQDAAIPDAAGESASSISFGVLEQAQALGDRQALLDAGRNVIRFHLGADPLANMARLARSLE